MMSRIKINKLVIVGLFYRRTLEFNKGLTVISGDKTSGKSLVLSLIDYCLGKGKKIDLKVQKELDEYCDQVFLEFEMNNEVLTVGRSIKSKTNKFHIYFCAVGDLDSFTPKIVDQTDYMQFLSRKMNVTDYKLVRYQKHSNRQELETVSFRDIFRYVYINQHDLGTHNFLSNKDSFKKYKNPHAFKMMLNLVERDNDDLKQRIVEANNKIEDTRKEVFGLKSYLKDRDAEDYLTLQSKQSEYLAEIDKRRKEKDSVIKNSRSNGNKENEMYVSLRGELTTIAEQVSEYERRKYDFQLSLNSKELLKQEYEVEREEIDATMEINYKLTKPEHNIECPLCKSKVQSHHGQQHAQNTFEAMSKVKKDNAAKIKMLNKMIEGDLSTIDELNLKIERLGMKQKILSDATVEFTKATEVPFLSQINSINSIVNSLYKESELLKECIRIHNKVVEKEKLIAELQSEKQRLEKEMENLQVNEDYKKRLFGYLDGKYRVYMSRFKYDSSIGTYIDSENYIPYYRGSSVYEHDSGGLLLCMQISYLSAILASKKDEYASGHPGILMLDSLSKYLGTLKKETQPLVESNETKGTEHDLINDPEVYEEIYKIIVELSADNQIIIVENTPPSLVDMYTKYIFLSGEKGLVNQEVNEFSELEQ